MNSRTARTGPKVQNEDDRCARCSGMGEVVNQAAYPMTSAGPATPGAPWRLICPRCLGTGRAWWLARLLRGLARLLRTLAAFLYRLSDSV